MNSKNEQPPEFNGQCAFALSIGKKDVAGNAAHQTIQQGKKYLFSNPVAKLIWFMLPGRKSKAEAHWKSNQR